MGGGPIMDLEELLMIRFAFKQAKRRKKKTALLGCGVGPLFDKIFKKITLDIFKYSDLSILRDRISFFTINTIAKELKCNLSSTIFCLNDPAIIPIGFFLKTSFKKETKKNMLINLRDFPVTIFKTFKKLNADKEFVEMIKRLSEVFPIISLVPNHTFFHGNDDRFYLSKIKQLSGCANVNVIQKPLSVFDLFSLIRNASACIGMRYHSIMFQTFINGRNAIIDYTIPSTGKIFGFLEFNNGLSHYKDWYLNMHADSFDLIGFSDRIKNITEKEKFIFDKNIFENTSFQYSIYLKKYL